MQIVIDIPEEDYKRMMEQSMFGRADVWKQAIKNGTPLPKGHGRLIDADALEGHKQIQSCGNGKYTEVTMYYQNDIDVAQTIIDTDTESEDEE